MSDHVRVAIQDRHVVAIIDDWELFDYIEDHLTEVFSLEHDYHTESKLDGRCYFTMHFAETISAEQVSGAIAQLPEGEVERIWRLNNTPSSEGAG